MKLTEATVVTSETVGIIWKKWERVDAANVGQIVNYQVRLWKLALQLNEMEFVIGQNRMGFHSQGHALIMRLVGNFGGDHHPAPVSPNLF